MDTAKFGSWIRRKRELAGITQDQLAHAVGVTNQAISKVENGRRMPKFPLILRLASALNANLNELAESQPDKWDREGIIP
jgi:transcriptional regulator with XRE-family HTH domain